MNRVEVSNEICDWSGKVIYKKKSDATGAANVISKRYRDSSPRLNVYYCEHCTHFHLGRAWSGAKKRKS